MDKDLLKDLEELLARGALDTIAPLPVSIALVRRGRPRVTPRHERPIRDMSPKELARYDLIETAQDWDSIVARGRAENITTCAAVVTRANTVTRPSQDRAKRIKLVARMLSESANRTLRGLSNSNIAGRIQASFPGIARDTLRKDIASAKKLARFT